jgi:PPM family protein phosphatase
MERPIEVRMVDADDDGGVRRRAMSPILRPEDYRPLSATVEVEIAGRTHPGTLRSINTDHYLVIRLSRRQETLLSSLAKADLPRTFDEGGYIMMVADGLGEAGSGAIASRLALSTFAHLAIHFGHWNVRVDAATAADIVDQYEAAYARLNEAVIQRARATPELASMATTLTAAYSAGDELFLVHVGNSRAYLFRDGHLTQMSSDQTLAQHMSENGGPAPVERATEDLRHILTETIGGRLGGPRIQVEHFRLWDGDRVLLCTDGLTDQVDEDRIADVLTPYRRLDEQCQALVDLAIEAGGKDNVTAVMAQYSIPKP